MSVKVWSWAVAAGLVLGFSGPAALAEEGTTDSLKEVLDDVALHGGITWIIQGAHNANAVAGATTQGEDVTDSSYSADITLEKTFDERSKAFVHVEAGDGAGVEDELEVFSGVNRDAADDDNSAKVTEAWYEYAFSEMPLTLTAGKIDAGGFIDNNAYANDETAQFLGSIFRNSPAIEFPADNGAGGHAGYSVSEYLDVGAVVAEADGDNEDVGDGVFAGLQLNFKPRLLGKDGSYRFYGWKNNLNHNTWLAAEKNNRDAYGFGLSFDQELTADLGVFLRCGWQDPDVYLVDAAYSLESAYSAGVSLKGSAWSRPDDVLAVAFGQIMPSDDYKKAGGLKARTESHLECYYSWQVNEHLAISPDIQVIWDPYGGDSANGDKAIIAAGVRGQVSF